jgi:hypothetical protein
MMMLEFANSPARVAILLRALFPQTKCPDGLWAGSTQNDGGGGLFGLKWVFNLYSLN